MLTVMARYDGLGDPYVRVKLSDGRVIGEHRLIIERREGRKLSRSEHAHHKNGLCRDNRIQNLELLTAGDHTRLHHRAANTATLKCPACGVGFQRTLRYIRSKQKLGQKQFLCGRGCRLSEKHVVHGTRNGYGYWRCRCALCRLAQANYMRKYLSRQ